MSTITPLRLRAISWLRNLSTPFSGGNRKLSSQHTDLTASSASTLHASEVENGLAFPEGEQGKEEKSEEEKRNQLLQLHTWDGPDDPDHPTNWPLWKKLSTTVMLAAITFTVSLNSAMFEPATQQVLKEFPGISREVTVLGTSLYLLGFCLGPPFWGPLSEKFGRKIPLLTGSGGGALFSLMPALGHNVPVILIGRFLAGACGASPATIVGGAASDNWHALGRGINITVAVGSIFGAPLFGPIIGGFITKSVTWRWTMWLMVILGGSVTAFCVVFLPETYAPVLLKRRTKRLRKSTGDPNIKCSFDNEKMAFGVVCNIYLVRPWTLLCTEPILVLVTIYQAFIYGILYLSLSAYPYAFHQARHWSTGVDGLPLLSQHIGILISVGLTVWYVVKRLAPRVAAANGKLVPEDRLPVMIFGAALFPAGLFWFAWTAANVHVHWIVPCLAAVVIGCGMFSVFLQCMAYLIEVYLPVANSAMASNGMVRSLFGAGFPLFASAMYNRLGVAWATSLLAFLAVAMIPIPVIFYVYGARIRSWSKNAVSGTADR
ncbi:MAG: hypothetical protein LQ351_006563 [Letrouitia transgressa]|nr:MAG: hypothetical protein LQ351_006563 [Letrouitia transgressa]